MKRLPHYLLLLCLAASACKKEDKTPKPKPEALKACFTPSALLVDSGDLVSFANCSSGSAASQRWDFGAGGKAVETHNAYTVYQKRGTYPVQLTVWNQSRSDSADTTINIVAGRHSITRINVNRYRLTDSSGSGWDADGSGPDVVVEFGPASNPKQYRTKVKTNADGSAFTVELHPNIVIDDAVNGPWYFRLLDEDNIGDDLMAVIRGAANPYYPSRDKASPVILTSSGWYAVSLDWELVP